MSGVEQTPCCCQQKKHPCCVTGISEFGNCVCKERSPNCPDSIDCEDQPDVITALFRKVFCVESEIECDQKAIEMCMGGNRIACSGQYFPQYTCDQVDQVDCGTIDPHICITYECGWCGELLPSNCYLDTGDAPCLPPPTCIPDPCCEPDPPTICCCRDGNGIRSVVAPCPDPIPPNCVQIQDPADCQNCGEYYTPMPCSSVCCCTTAGCVVLWDIPPGNQPAGHCATGFGGFGDGCISDCNNPNPITLNYCCCSCFPCEYCSTDPVALAACFAAMQAAGKSCLCPVVTSGLCNCDPPNPLIGPSESAAPPPVSSLQSGVVLDSNNKPTINNLFLLGYGTFNL